MNIQNTNLNDVHEIPIDIDMQCAQPMCKQNNTNKTKKTKITKFNKINGSTYAISSTTQKDTERQCVRDIVAM